MEGIGYLGISYLKYIHQTKEGIKRLVEDTIPRHNTSRYTGVCQANYKKEYTQAYLT